MNPLHLDLFIRLLLDPVEWLVRYASGVAFAQTLLGPAIAAAVRTVQAVIAGCGCCGLLVVGMLVLIVVRRRSRR